MTKWRINKFVAQCLGISRRKAEELIKSGHVKMNEQTIYDLSLKVQPNSSAITVHGEVLSPRTYIYYALNKPLGYTSTRHDPFATKKVVDLVPSFPAVYPAGRLDKNSEGLIVLTNDGEITQKITSPADHLEKEYYVEATVVRSNWDIRQLKKLLKGVDIGGYTTKPSRIFAWRHTGKNVSFYIILEEGKKRQIRRMAQKIGLEIKTLRRVRIGKLKLGDLKPGEYRKIRAEDIL